jgi:SAM-dependent methyltransferase
MTLPGYEYKGLIAEAWDVLRGDTSNWEDRHFYLELIRRNDPPVLDVGCGTGRLLLDYLAQGIDIDGVDNSPDMLALCRGKAEARGLAPALYEQFIEALDLPRRYGAILVPSSSFQLIIDPAMAAEALRRIHHHLLPGGAAAASIMALRKSSDPLEFEWETTAERARDGAVFRRVLRSRFDPATQLEHTEDLYQLLRGGQVVAEEQHRRSPATRAYTAAQARAAFEAAGFERVELLSEFTFEPLKPADNMFVVLGHKAA